MLLQTVRASLLQVRELDTTPVAIDMDSHAFIDDEGMLHFKIRTKQADGSALIETIKFNRYETQKIRAVLSKA